MRWKGNEVRRRRRRRRERFQSISHADESEREGEDAAHRGFIRQTINVFVVLIVVCLCIEGVIFILVATVVIVFIGFVGSLGFFFSTIEMFDIDIS